MAKSIDPIAAANTSRRLERNSERHRWHFPVSTIKPVTGLNTERENQAKIKVIERFMLPFCWVVVRGSCSSASGMLKSGYFNQRFLVHTVSFPSVFQLTTMMAMKNMKWTLIKILTGFLLASNMVPESSAFLLGGSNHWAVKSHITSAVPSSPTIRRLSVEAFTEQIASLPQVVTAAAAAAAFPSQTLAAWDLSSMDKDAAETLAGPLFGFSLFPYLAFIYFLNVEENQCPKGVTVGFASCLLFVFLTIPAAIAAKLLYSESLANCDWLHGSAESMLTFTNLATVIPFRQALDAKDKSFNMPASATSYAPMLWLIGALTAFALASAATPALMDPSVHTPYLGGFMDLPTSVLADISAHPEPENALTVATWIIHVSSLVEFLVVMGFCWRWADVVQNPKWKGLTWGLIPLHSSGITACVSHLFYNQIAALVPLQAFLTCVGNSTAAYAAYRIAVSNGWKSEWESEFLFPSMFTKESLTRSNAKIATDVVDYTLTVPGSQSLVGFEDLGDALAEDNDLSFLLKLYAGCALFSYLVKYGATVFDFPFEPSLFLAIIFIAVPTALNAIKWSRRSDDPTFDGWL